MPWLILRFFSAWRPAGFRSWRSPRCFACLYLVTLSARLIVFRFIVSRTRVKMSPGTARCLWPRERCSPAVEPSAFVLREFRMTSLGCVQSRPELRASHWGRFLLWKRMAPDLIQPQHHLLTQVVLIERQGHPLTQRGLIERQGHPLTQVVLTRLPALIL